MVLLQRDANGVVHCGLSVNLLVGLLSLASSLLALVRQLARNIDLASPVNGNWERFVMFESGSINITRKENLSLPSVYSACLMQTSFAGSAVAASPLSNRNPQLTSCFSMHDLLGWNQLAFQRPR